MSLKPPEEGAICVSPLAGEREGELCVELTLDGAVVSNCRIVPVRLRFGVATVLVDGIGRVETLPEYRGRGLAGRVMNAAIERMRAGDAALSMLYGIAGYYPRFGYAPVGPESTITFPALAGEVPVPAGWRVRAMRHDHLPTVQGVYEKATYGGTAAAIRTPGAYPWATLRESIGGETEDCRVIEDERGRLVGYVWRGERLQFVRAHAEFNPGDLVMAEAFALSPRAADAVIAVCRHWASEEAARRGREARNVILFMPHEGMVAGAARHVDSSRQEGCGPDGGWMGRVLDTPRLLRQLQPELSRRSATVPDRCIGTVHLVTEVGDAILRCAGGEVAVEEPRGTEDAPMFPLPQTVLAQLVTGAFDPGDLLTRLPAPPGAPVGSLLEVLFSARTPHVYLADRF